MYIADGVPLVESENDDTLLLRVGVYILPYDMKFYSKSSIKSRKQNIYRIIDDGLSIQTYQFAQQATFLLNIKGR